MVLAQDGVIENSKVIGIHAHDSLDGWIQLRDGAVQGGVGSAFLFAKGVPNDRLGQFDGGGRQRVLRLRQHRQSSIVQCAGCRREYSNCAVTLGLHSDESRFMFRPQLAPERFCVVSGRTDPRSVPCSVATSHSPGFDRTFAVGADSREGGEGESDISRHIRPRHRAAP
jgi:hypothetical protein